MANPASVSLADSLEVTMRTSILLVAVIRSIAIVANVASLVAHRFAAALRPGEMLRLCYLDRHAAVGGRPVTPIADTWRSKRSFSQPGFTQDPSCWDTRG